MDVANEMDAEDGLIWVYERSGRHGVHRLRHRTLTGIIEIYKADPSLKRSSGAEDSAAAYAACLR